MGVRYFEDVRVGDQIGPTMKVVTTEMVLQFCQVWGAKIPNRFTDEQVARNDGVPHALIPGIMSMAMLTSLVTSWAPGGQVGRIETLFRRPVPHNQPLRLVGVVSGKAEADGDRRVECDLHLEREDGEELVAGTAALILPSREG